MYVNYILIKLGMGWGGLARQRGKAFGAEETTQKKEGEHCI